MQLPLVAKVLREASALMRISSNYYYTRASARMSSNMAATRVDHAHCNPSIRYFVIRGRHNGKTKEF